MLPPDLVREVEALRTEGASIDLSEAEGWANVVLHDHPLPEGFNKRSTELLTKFPLSYPNGQPDMFWTDPDLTLKGGQVPQSADRIETALGKQWRRFSWHPQKWNPGVDDLRTYLEFVENRLAKAV
jgi:hypothetical protein